MSFFKKSTALILVCITVLSLAVGILPSAASESDSVNILACSDFQHPDGNNEGRKEVSAILSAMKEDGITKADGLFACGDYDYDFTDTKSGIAMLSQTLKSFVSQNKIFVQGNHDSANSAAGTNGLAHSGNNDPAHGKYGAFVINEDDYMWYNDDEDTIKRTTQKLIDYLNEKLAEGYTKPIFILSHLGLHYTMRTNKEGDGKHAHYLVNALNEAGKKGLNLVVIYGHNHSNGWDDYLGGPAVFLNKGDPMLVGQGTNTRRKSETIHFTYLNAGYTGYYSNVNGQDDALTMTYITVTDDKITFVRYDKEGKHDLKSAGVTNAYHGESGYQPNTTVYASPQSVSLTPLSDKTPLKNLLNIDKTQPVWKKITSLDELADGGRYLIIRNNAPDSIMIPDVVVKSYTDGSERIGFDLLDTADFGDALAFASLSNAEWTFQKTSGGWLIGNGETFITRRPTDDQGISAILTEEGSVMQIKGEGGAFTFYNGSGYSFNYNKRHLINFYTSDPAYFHIYEAAGHLVTVENGKVEKEGIPAVTALAGDALTFTASPAPEGFVFDQWEIVGDSLTVGPLTSATLTLVMPDAALSLKATYKTADTPTTTDPTLPDTPNEDPSDGTVILIVSITAAVLLVGSSVIIFIIKKKK